MDEKNKKDYELAVLVKNDDDLAGVGAFVRQHNGEMAAEPRAKRLTLAYEIKKNKEAVFAYCTFKAAGEDAKNLERDLNTKPEVIRFLIIASPAPAGSMGSMGDQRMAPDSGPKRRTRVMRPGVTSDYATDAKPAAPRPLSNEALEKKIEEILQ
jgi:ribosomal protein S6